MVSLLQPNDDLHLLPTKSASFQETFQTNELVFGELLGSGGFGSVCECYFRNKKYALKKFHRSQKNERAVNESFACENIIVNLRHPNIVQTFLTFRLEETYCVLMEFVSRKTLENIINDSTEIINFSRRLGFAFDISEGLRFAHGNNIAHLDLKPANILVTPTGKCKIADFGCCKRIGEFDQPSTPTKSNLTGTYSYRAPELLRGEPATLKADIYSLGICLWQMLVRERPYGNEHHQVIIFKVVAYNLRPHLPEEMSREDLDYVQLVEQCWNKDKTLRPSAVTVSKFAENALR